MQYRYDRSFPDGPDTAAPEQRGILREHARQIRFSRDRRQKFFDRNLFGEPAWDILLTLYVIDDDQRRLSTRQIADLARQPLTTALRWLDYLDDEDLIRRRPNPLDQRVIFVELSDKGRAAIDRYLMMLRGADMIAPVTISR